VNLWENWNKRLKFLENIPSEELRLHVGFLYFLGSPITVDYWVAQQQRNGNLESANQIKSDFERITQGIDEKYIWSENDLNAELFSIDYLTVKNKKVVLNTDVLRTQIDITNLVKFNLLPRLKNIVEVGGGYGHLALAILKLFPEINYRIIDYSQQLKIISRYLSYNGIETSYGSDSQVQLIDQEKILEPVTCDLLVNVNSFCEMPINDILKYVNQKLIKYDVLYSNNRENQFMNSQLNEKLSTIFKKVGFIYPELEDYLAHENDFHKYVFLVSPDSNFYESSLLSISKIVGITGKGNLNGLGN
jgi:hypothetical protein